MAFRLIIVSTMLGVELSSQRAIYLNFPTLDTTLKSVDAEELTKQEWKKIWEIRDANYEVITCGNMGSYKQYRSTSKELLSDEAINGNYLMFREIGYLWR